MEYSGCHKKNFFTVFSITSHGPMKTDAQFLKQKLINQMSCLITIFIFCVLITLLIR